MNKKHIIISFIAGIIVAIVAYYIYVVFAIRAEVNQDHTTIGQIVNFLNANQSKSQDQAQGAVK